jgi:hypothetical protein
LQLRSARGSCLPLDSAWALASVAALASILALGSILALAFGELL